jgi:uncharacterized protein (DUF488 family)
VATILYTIGHSNHPADRFILLLRQHEIGAIADVRSYPSSGRWPQFNQAALIKAVEEHGIAYRWLQTLGGRRRSKPKASRHTAWKVAAFRAYADYADGLEFAAGLAMLIALAGERRTAFMCAEGLWWQCHRRIIADHLTVSGCEVRHILPNGALVTHQLPQFARIDDGRLIYDGGQPPLTLTQSNDKA